MASLLDTALAKLKAEEEKVALSVGRGTVAREDRDERIGLAKGLRRAIELVTAAAGEVNKQDD